MTHTTPSFLGKLYSLNRLRNGDAIYWWKSLDGRETRTTSGDDLGVVKGECCRVYYHAKDGYHRHTHAERQ